MIVHSAETEWDVVVIGAGPAGSAAAVACARIGLRTALLDRAAFPRDKVCGCCLNEGAIATIAELGAASALASLEPQPFRTLQLHARGKSAELQLRPGLAVSRRALDHMLAVHAVANGVHVRTGVAATVMPRDADLWRVRADDEDLRARVVIVADGLQGSALRGLAGWSWRVAPRSRMGLAARLPAATKVPAGAIVMAVARAGYVGLVRLEDETVELAAAVDPHAFKQAGDPLVLLHSILDEAGFPIERQEWISSCRGTALLSRRRERVEADGLFVVGDAARYVEPFTGEGMSWALSGGLEVAEYASAACRGVYEDGTWTRTLATVTRTRQRRCGWIARGLRHPAAVGVAVRVLARSPGLASRAGRMFGERLKDGPRLAGAQ